MWNIVKKYGWIGTILHYIVRAFQKLFALYFFNRTDIRVTCDLHVTGSKYMSFGKKFVMGRGGRLECIYENSANTPEAQIFSPELIFGDNVNIGEYVHIGCNNKIVIGNNVLMGSKIYITDHNHGIYNGTRQSKPDTAPVRRKLTVGEHVIIGDNVWVGEFVTILPGVTIGNGSIIGSHSTVTHDIPCKAIAVGSPARVIKIWNENKKCWERLKKEEKN